MPTGIAPTDHEIHAILEESLIHERSTMAFYDEIIRLAGFDDNVTRRVIEDVVVAEAAQAAAFARLLEAIDADRTDGETAFAAAVMRVHARLKQGKPASPSVGAA